MAIPWDKIPESAVIDAHIHSGIQYSRQRVGISAYRAIVKGSPIQAAVAFAPVEEIYDRSGRTFTDTPEWQASRENANRYVLHASDPEFTVIPYFFVWNDFNLNQLSSGAYAGIKWHRHEDEPEYEYHTESCRRFIEWITARGLPVVLEESFENTLRFIEVLAPEAKIIIPHLGFLNGGYRALKKAGVFAKTGVYADTSLASREEITDYIENFGHARLLFGSDFPFGHPVSQLRTLEKTGLPGNMLADLTRGNLMRLLGQL